MSFLADAIRDHVGIADTPPWEAILAAVEACEAAHADSPDTADAVELAIARALNVGIPLKHLDAFRELHDRLTND